MNTTVKQPTVKQPDMIAQAIAKYGTPDETIAKIQTEYMPLSVKENGIETVSGARKEVKRLRISIENKRKELKADALAFGKAVDGEAKRLTDLIVPVEQHLQEEEDVYEAGKAMEKRIKLEAQQRKTQERVNTLTAAGVKNIDLIAVQSLTDAAFELLVSEQIKLAEEARIEAERLETIRLEEQARQAEELRIRAEELEAERQAMLVEQAKETAERERLAAIEADRLKKEWETFEAEKAEQKRLADLEQARLAEERKRLAAIEVEKQRQKQDEIDAERAEQQRILDEERAALAAERDRLVKEAAAVKAAEDARKAEADRLAAIERKRIRDEEEAENLRQWNEEQARLQAEKTARQEALKPEILKAETFCNRLRVHADEILRVLEVSWSFEAMKLVESCCEEVEEMVARR